VANTHGQADTASGVTLLQASVGGDGEAFGLLVAPHRRELLAHCYRMLGSLEDAEDVVQEALLKAWRALSGFQGRSSLRAWLYRIATNTCLDALDRRARRVLPAQVAEPADPAAPPAPEDAETPWLQPYPDLLLEIADPDPLADPLDAAAQREHVELAFVAAIQHLPPRQRAVLLLRDVLGWTAPEAAVLLKTSEAAVNSALQRARQAVDGRLPERDRHRPSADEAALIGRYVRAWHAADIPALVALLRADVDLAMPPTPSWYHGRDAVAAYLRQLFGSPQGRHLRLRPLPTGANRQPALAVYTPVATTSGEPGLYMPLAIQVLTVHGDLVTNITGFTDPRLFPAFRLPRAERLSSARG
jgi:RNA polymerase sigma-70 factor (ECF subfamily)